MPQATVPFPPLTHGWKSKLSRAFAVSLLTCTLAGCADSIGPLVVVQSDHHLLAGAPVEEPQPILSAVLADARGRLAASDAVATLRAQGGLVASLVSDWANSATDQGDYLDNSQIAAANAVLSNGSLTMQGRDDAHPATIAYSMRLEGRGPLGRPLVTIQEYHYRIEPARDGGTPRQIPLNARQFQLYGGMYVPGTYSTGSFADPT
ncbi:MAG TPA: hypothetical protein VK737_09265, partial [Opitutales bacterium]|nr:hypothetical protein [Opitutales bacterium]